MSNKQITPVSAAVALTTAIIGWQNAFATKCTEGIIRNQHPFPYGPSYFEVVEIATHLSAVTVTVSARGDNCVLDLRVRANDDASYDFAREVVEAMNPLSPITDIRDTHTFTACIAGITEEQARGVAKLPA